jgi:hypothetical protein
MPVIAGRFFAEAISPKGAGIVSIAIAPSQRFAERLNPCKKVMLPDFF